MLELVTALIAQALPYAIAAGGALIAAIAWGFHQRIAGAKAERAKQAAEEAHARAVAGKVDNDVGAMPADAVRQELKTWAEKQ